MRRELLVAPSRDGRWPGGYVITAEGIASPNPCRATVGNPAGHAAMRMTAFKKGWTNRRRCKATKRDGTPCGRLAMTRYSLSVAAGTADVANLKNAWQPER